MNFRKTNWSLKDYQEFQKYLKSRQEEKYQKFTQKLVNSQYKIMGIRMPILRKIAKEIAQGNYESFLKVCKPLSYEEVLIKGFVIASIKDIDKLKLEINDYVKLIDNWAICDSFAASLKIVKDNKPLFWNYFQGFLASQEEYYIRLALVVFLNYYVEKDYLNSIFSLCLKDYPDKYYINMALAWLLSICYIKYPQETYTFLETSSLNKFIFNKTISKIKDSYQVSKFEKEKLTKLKKARNML